MLKRIQLFDDSKAETYCTAAEIYKFDTHRGRKGLKCLLMLYVLMFVLQSESGE